MSTTTPPVSPDMLAVEFAMLRRAFVAVDTEARAIRVSLDAIEEGLRAARAAEAAAEAKREEMDARPAGPAFWRQWNASMRDRAERMIDRQGPG